jgi:hypothetical protein
VLERYEGQLSEGLRSGQRERAHGLVLWFQRHNLENPKLRAKWLEQMAELRLQEEELHVLQDELHA